MFQEAHNPDSDWKLWNDLYRFAHVNMHMFEALRAPKYVLDFIFDHLGNRYTESIPTQCQHIYPNDFDKKCPTCFVNKYRFQKDSHRARKLHACDECKNPIVHGDVYWSSGHMYAKHCWRCVFADAMTCFAKEA